MVKIYGSMLCKDCVECVDALTGAGVAFEFLDFADGLSNLKEFLAIRDRDPQFEAVRAESRIGIPCILRRDGSVTLDWQELM